MSERKRAKKRKDEYTGPGGADQPVEKPNKDEIAIAKWIKSNVPVKKTKFLNHNVEYFIASKALDGLMASKYAQGENSLFLTREAAIEFLDNMLIHKFFHRAKKVPVSEQELKGRSKKTANVDKEKEKEEKCTDAESSHVESKNVEKVEKEKEKRKRKIRLDMHPDQLFVDGPEAYVWIYDPIPFHYWLFGTLLVIGAIVICLFPLWPPSLRKGVYYLSIAAAGFLVFILGLALLRFVLFCLVWMLTGSKHHFWLFPNLTEDVGFFASFWPIYKHEIRDNSVPLKKTKKKKKDKDSDAEDEPTVADSGTAHIKVSTPLLDQEKIENIKENDTGTLPKVVTKEMSSQKSSDVKASGVKIDENDDQSDRKNSLTPSESESESSQRSSTGKDFEMVDPADVDTS